MYTEVCKYIYPAYNKSLKNQGSCCTSYTQNTTKYQKIRVVVVEAYPDYNKYLKNQGSCCTSYTLNATKWQKIRVVVVWAYPDYNKFPKTQSISCKAIPCIQQIKKKILHYPLEFTSHLQENKI